jgi:integration host factor subunit beta
MIARLGGMLAMSTKTKKDLIDRIAEETDQSRTAVKRTVQSFLNQVIRELSEGNRLEFRDFGVFELRHRSERTAQNPRTLEPITVPASNTVRFKAGRLMKMALDGEIDPRSLTPIDDDAKSSDTNNRAQSTGDHSRPDGKREVEYEVLVGSRNQRT